MSETLSESHGRRPKKPQVSEATKKRRREILDAALRCFLRHGVAGTTIEQICAESGASSGSIYHLFSGKSEIALTLFVEGMRKYHEKIVQALKGKTTARTAIRAIIATHLQDNVDEPARSLFETRMGMADEIEQIGEQYRQLNDEFSEAIWRHLKPFVDRGELTRLRPELYFSLIIGPSAHLVRSWFRERVSFDLLSATDDLAEAAWKSLRKDSGIQ